MKGKSIFSVILSFALLSSTVLAISPVDASVSDRIVPRSIVTTLDSSGLVGQYTSLAIGSDGLPIISYYDYTAAALKTAKCANIACTSVSSITIVDPQILVGHYTSIAIGTDNNPVISYRDFAGYNMKVAKCTTSDCTGTNHTVVGDPNSNTGYFTSIAIGLDGNPVISYTNFTPYDDLKVLKCGNPSCSSGNVITTLDSAGVTGRSTSIMIGNHGNPVISYYDFTNGNLKIATCGNPSCTSGNVLSTVDSVGNVGFDTSIVKGFDGNPVISYYDSTNQDLKIVKCYDLNCKQKIIRTLDSAGDVGKFSSIDLNSYGNPMISYYDATNGNLKLAVCTSQSCDMASYLVIDGQNGDDVGKYTSLKVGSSNNPVISYFDETNDDLKSAYVSVYSSSIIKPPIYLDY